MICDFLTCFFISFLLRVLLKTFCCSLSHFSDLYTFLDSDQFQLLLMWGNVCLLNPVLALLLQLTLMGVLVLASLGTP